MSPPVLAFRNPRKPRRGSAGPQFSPDMERLIPLLLRLEALGMGWAIRQMTLLAEYMVKKGQAGHVNP